MCAPPVTQHTSTRYSSSCHTCVNMSASIFFAAAMIRGFRSTRSHGNGGTNTFAYFARNARCTVSTDLLVWYSNTQNDFSPGAAIFSLHTLASPSGRNVNYDKKTTYWGKKLSCSFYLYRLRKYVSCGFPAIFFAILEYIMKRPVLRFYCFFYSKEFSVHCLSLNWWGFF